MTYDGRHDMHARRAWDKLVVTTADGCRAPECAWHRACSTIYAGRWTSFPCPVAKPPPCYLVMGANGQSPHEKGPLARRFCKVPPLASEKMSYFRAQGAGDLSLHPSRSRCSVTWLLQEHLARARFRPEGSFLRPLQGHAGRFEPQLESSRWTSSLNSLVS